MHQHTIELAFHVDTLRASLFKSSASGEKALGDVSFHGFALAFDMAQYVMNVNITLRYTFSRLW